MEDIWRPIVAALGPYVVETAVALISALGALATAWLRKRAQKLAGKATVIQVESTCDEKTDAKIDLAASQMRETMGAHIKPLTLNSAKSLARQLRKELDDSKP